MPVMIRDYLATLDNRSALQAALLIFFFLGSSEGYYVGCAHFFSDIQLVGNRQRDFYQAFNIELVFVLRFPTESNYSPPLSSL